MGVAGESIPSRAKKENLTGVNLVRTVLSFSFHLELGCEVWSCSRYLATRRRGVRVEGLLRLLEWKDESGALRAWLVPLACSHL